MPPLRPPTGLTRPSIYELATTLLSPTTCHALRSHPHTRIQAHTISNRSGVPKSRDRGPPSNETTQTSFEAMDVLGRTPAPGTAIDACLWNGFHLDNGFKVNGAGVLLISGEVFEWRPWRAASDSKRLVDRAGRWHVPDEAWGLLGVVWPKPDLLIIGLGKEMRPISPETRRYINSLGIRVDIQDTRNAAAQFNLLATERGVSNVAAAMIPLGWREGVGIELSSSSLNASTTSDG